MDTTSLRCLINSISRFIHLVSCQTRRPVPIQKSFGSMVMVLKHLKPVLDEVIDYEISLDDVLCKECEKLDVAVNEAREFMENWSLKMSKICSVRQSEALLMKIKSSSLEIYNVFCKSTESSPSTSSLTGIKQYMQELQCLKQETIAEDIEDALTCQRNDVIPSTDNLMKIIKSLSLTPKQEFLKESVAVEKERMRVQVNKAKGELYQIDQIVDLISHIRNCLLKVSRFEPKSGVQVPPYFRCPLSLELMSDPVIVASGQTYERASIQKWLDHGLIICPKTRQTLSHTNLIPNYTVKSMIANWREENNIKLSSSSEDTKLIVAPSQLQDDSLHSHSWNSISTSGSCVGSGFEKQNADGSSRYIHSGIESALIAISSIEYVPQASNELSSITTKHENVSDLSGEIRCASLSNKKSGSSPWSSWKKFPSPKKEAYVASNGNDNESRDSGSGDLTKTSHVKKLIEDLKSQSNEVQTAAAEELRLLSKHDTENRIIIGCCGAIPPLLSLLYSEVKLTQEHAVTALLNLSISEEAKAMIAESGAIEPLVHVLKSGNNEAKQNSAITLFSLSVLEEYKEKIGRSGAVKALVDLLHSGTLRGKKDAATALFNLSILHENKVRMVQAGAVKYLVKLMDPDSEMVDKAAALLANLSTIGEGCVAILQARGITSLIEIVESGSRRGKENAASVLMQLCINNPKSCNLILQEGAVPPLVALSQSGTPRAKEKAQLLLSHFRNQREGTSGKRKS